VYDVKQFTNDTKKRILTHIYIYIYLYKGNARAIKEILKAIDLNCLNSF